MGLFDRFFGKNKDADNQPQNAQVAPKRQRAQAYYLEGDDAKTLGNVEYMRKANKIKRSFPKSTITVVNGEVSQEISAMEKRAFNGKMAEPQSETVAESKAATQNGQANGKVNFERRRADSSMDMFRNMARQMKKPQ